MSLLVFSDLDGSLMEHEGYSIEPAHEALTELTRRKVPLILNSSKTAAEMEAIQEMLGLSAPFVCENGAALHQGSAGVIAFGTERERWLQRLHALRGERGYDFEGFGDWSAAELAELTGLSTEQASLAKRRVYSEPILWRDTDTALQRFKDDLIEFELRVLQGGRFLSVQGHYDKGGAVEWMRTKASQGPSEAPLVIALGDSPNDAAMLDAADVAVIIASAKSSQIHCSGARRVIHTRHPGPAGWNEAILQILALYDDGRL